MIWKWTDIHETPPEYRKLVWLKIGKTTAMMGYRVNYPDPLWPFRRSKSEDIFLDIKKSPITDNITHWCEVSGPWFVQDLVDRYKKLKAMEEGLLKDLESQVWADDSTIEPNSVMSIGFAQATSQAIRLLKKYLKDE